MPVGEMVTERIPWWFSNEIIERISKGNFGGYPHESLGAFTDVMESLEEYLQETLDKFLE